MQDLITDRRKGFFMVENSIIDEAGLDPYELAVYLYILRHVNGKSGVAFPSMTRIASGAKMSKPKVNEAIKTLELKGLISVERTFKEGTQEKAVNRYFIESYGGEVVNVVNYGSKPDLLQVVNDVDYNNTDIKKTIPAERVRDIVFDTVATVFYNFPPNTASSELYLVDKKGKRQKAGGRIAMLAKAIRTWLPDLNDNEQVETIKAFATAYLEKSEYLPTHPDTLEPYFLAYIARQKAGQGVGSNELVNGTGQAKKRLEPKISDEERKAALEALKRMRGANHE